MPTNVKSRAERVIGVIFPLRTTQASLSSKYIKMSLDILSISVGSLCWVPPTFRVNTLLRIQLQQKQTNKQRPEHSAQRSKVLCWPKSSETFKEFDLVVASMKFQEREVKSHGGCEIQTVNP